MFRIRYAVFAFAAAALAACGGGDRNAGGGEPADKDGVIELSRADQRAAERRERARQQAIAENEADFTYFRYRIDVAGDEPKACFVFSSALQPETDYSPFVDFRPAFRPALSVEGRELCVGGLEFGTSRTAILRSGLPAEDGRALDRDEEVPIDFDDRPPYVGFKGGGVILPRLEADGLAIETVNVDEVKLTVSRVNDRALAFKRVSQGETAGEGRYAYLYGDEDPRDVAEEIWTGSMPVESVDNAPVVTVFPIGNVVGTLEPGAYFVEVQDAKKLSGRDGPPAAARRWIMLTDLALTAFEGGHGLDVTLRSLQSGEALAGSRIALIARNNDILAEVDTDSNGRAQFDAPLLAGSGPAQARLVMAYGADGDIAILDLDRAPVDLSSEAVGGRRTPGEVDAYLYTERGIYRPGETVHLAALLRDRAGKSIGDRAGAVVIYRPNGLEAARIRFDEADGGAVLHDYALSSSASRGRWRAAIEIDGAGQAGSVAFSVEDFVPQRIKVSLDETETTPLMMADIRDIDVEARFLYGAPGAGLTVQSQARIEPDPSPFERFEGFRFGKSDNAFRGRILEFPDQAADGSGKAVIRVDPRGQAREADIPLRINAVVSVLEPGGRAVSESVRIPYRPRDAYLGIRRAEAGADAGENAYAFDLAMVDAETGEARAARLSWKVVAIDYHYDWYRDSDGRWRWRRSRTVATVNEGIATAPTGGVAQVAVEGLDWGDHQLIVSGPDGHEADYSFWVGWGGRVGDDGVEAPDRVSVRAPEEPVAVGRTADIAVVSPYAGQAQIVVATDRVLSVSTRAVPEGVTNLRLPVTEDWGEGAYVMVSVYSPRDPVLRAKPRRAVGVAYTPADMSRRTYELAINAPEVTRPRREQLVTVDVDGGPGERVYLTLAAVDEGILRLTKFESPDPAAYIFGKKSLGVSLYDDYGRLLDPNLGLPAEVRTGGDQLGGEGLSVVPTKTVALFSGLVEVGRSGRAQIRFDLPDFNGELRLMAVAWSETGLGAASQSMIVRDPVPSELILPRFLAPGDEALATASIDNVEGDSGVFEASVAAEGPVSTASAGTASRSIPQGQRADEPVRLASSATGVANLTLAIEGPGGFSVDRTYQIESRSPYLPVSNVTRVLTQPGDSFTVDASLLADFDPGSGEVAVSFSTLPVDATALYDSLARYPYGCTEQTVSRALPLLYSAQLLAEGESPLRGEGSDTRLQESITKLLARQSPDGAFGLWREGDRYASPWIGAYTTEFLARAKAEGYSVPDEALERAYGALQEVAQGEAWRVYGYDTDVWESQWHQDTQQKLMSRSAPYALYVLARAGEANISRLRYLHDRDMQRIGNPLARAHLAAALAHMGDRARAKSAFDAALSAIGYENDGDYYQTPLRDIAGVLALAAETGFDDVVTELAEQIGADTPEPYRLTTQEKAFLLVAVNSLTRGQTGVDVEVNGLGRGNDNDRRYVLSEADLAEGVTFTLGGEAQLFRTIVARGAPTAPPEVAASNLRASKVFRTLSGGAIDLADVRQGDQLVAVLTLTPEERRTNPLIIADLLPAGFEIEAVLRPADAAADGAFSWIGVIDYPRVAEARDDRFLAAIDVRADAVKLAYLVRAVTPGDFALPGVTAEDMYRPDVFARSEAGRVQIAPQSGGAGGAP
ncbi:MAG: alpha-2-macroglobulin [Pseudomonadota bacterium]